MSKRFFPKDRVVVVAFGPFSNKIGYVRGQAGTVDKKVWDDYDHTCEIVKVPVYKVELGKYELSFSADELVHAQPHQK